MKKTLPLLLLALCLSAGAPRAHGQPKKDDFAPKIEGTDVKKPEVPKVIEPTGKKARPGLSAEDLYRVQPSASEEKLQAAIDSLYRIIDYAADDDPEKPVYYARLANLYWEKAESYFMQAYSDAMDKEQMEAEKSGDQAAIDEANRKRDLLLESQKDWRRKAVKIFQEIEQKYPDYDRLDMVLFYLGNFSAQMGDNEAGYGYYTRLVTNFPESKYIPDALVNMGEYYFQKDEFDTAVEFYKRLEKFTDSRMYPFAVYKMAWCHYNMGEYEDAFKKFVEVIQYAMKMEASGQGPKIGLKSEAQKDIVLAYSQVGKEGKAIAFFRSIAPDIYLVLSARLAQLYSEQGDPEKAIHMYKEIIAEDSENPNVLTYQRLVVENADKTTNKVMTRQEVERLVKLWEIMQGENSPVVMSERDKIEELLRAMAIVYHVEAQKTMEKKAMLLAQEVYDQYLNHFPQGQGRYQMVMNHAILLYQLQQYDKAVVEYEKVIELDPAGKYAREAGYTALLCYYKLIDVSKQSKVKVEEEDEGAEAQELPPQYANMVRACDRFVALQPEEKEELVQAKFAAAKILYDFNHFAEAAPRLAELVESYPTDESTPDSAKLLLSCYSMTRDIKNLNAWAEKLYLMPALAQGDLLAIIMKIRDRAKFNRCFQYEFDKQYEAAADCFMDYTVKFPDTNLKDKSIYNAALNYQRAKKYEKALGANAALYNCCAKTSPLGPRALFLIAETYRMAAVYEQAADYYEQYAAKHPTEAKVQEALIYASKFRRGMGDYEKAIKDYQVYIDRFRKDAMVPAVYFDIGVLYAKQGKYKDAISSFKNYLSKYRAAGGVNLALAAYQEMGQIYAEQKDVKATRGQSDAIIQAFQKLTPEEKKDIDRKGVSAIAWAYFNLGESLFSEAAKVKLARKTLKEDTEKKMKILLDGEKNFLTVLGLKQPYWDTAALTKIGQAWERFATEFENSPMPPDLTDMEKEEYKLQLSDAAQQFRTAKAAAAYKRCIEEAREYHIYNEYTEKAEERLSQLEFQFAGMKEYRMKPGFHSPGVNPPSFRVQKISIFQPAPEVSAPPGAAPATPAPGGDQK